MNRTKERNGRTVVCDERGDLWVAVSWDEFWAAPESRRSANMGTGFPMVMHDADESVRRSAAIGTAAR